jgi:hypothetical protein
MNYLRKNDLSLTENTMKEKGADDVDKTKEDKTRQKQEQQDKIQSSRYLQHYQQPTSESGAEYLTKESKKPTDNSQVQMWM